MKIHKFEEIKQHTLNQWVKVKITRAIGKYLWTNENNNTYQNLTQVSKKAVLKEKSIAINT